MLDVPLVEDLNFRQRINRFIDLSRKTPAPLVQFLTCRIEPCEYAVDDPLLFRTAVVQALEVAKLFSRVGRGCIDVGCVSAAAQKPGGVSA